MNLCLEMKRRKKIAAVSLSNSTIQRRIEELAADIRDQVVQEIKSAAFGLFSTQLEESTDVASYFQLIYIYKTQSLSVCLSVCPL